MKRLFFVLWLVLEGAFACAVWAADPPQCLARYTTELAELAVLDRRRIIGASSAYGLLGRQGFRLFLEYRAYYNDGPARLAGFYTNFRYGTSLVPSRFPSEEALLAAVARIQRRRPDPAVGIEYLSRVMAELSQTGNPGLAKAAVFELHYVDAEGLSIAGFRKEVSANGERMVADHLTADGLLGEVKALANPYDIAPGELTSPRLAGDIFVYNDPLLSSLAEETTRLIIIRRGNYGSLRLIFDGSNPLVPAQRSDLVQVLLKQFETPRVQNALRDAAQAQQAAFAQALNDPLNSILIYY